MGRCNSCGRELDDSWKYCVHCGAPTKAAIPGAIRPSPPPDAGSREPTANLPLRWGSYRARYVGALVLLIAGGLLVQATSAFSLPFLGIGFALHAAGWAILPGAGWRRALVIVPSGLATVLVLNGASSAYFLAIPLAAWFLARQRPWPSYLSLVFPIGTAAILAGAFPQYGDNALVIAIAGAVVVASAWIGRSLTVINGRNRMHSR